MKSATRKHRKDFDPYGDLKKIKAILAGTTIGAKDIAGDYLMQQFEDVKDKSNEVQETVTDYVTEKPIKSIGLALLTGAVIGWLIHK